jgi:molecular chaperone Hsp33
MSLQSAAVHDEVIRVMTADNAFRIIAVRMRQTLDGVLSAQKVSGDEASQLAELLVGAVLVRETTLPGRRVQLLLRPRGGGALVADALPGGRTRGVSTLGMGRGAAGALTDRMGSNGSGVIQVNYTLPSGALHQGIVGVPEDGSVPTALMRYLQESEQVVAVLDVAAREVEDGWAAVGYVVQLLPEAESDALARMTEHLAGLAPLGDWLAAQHAPADALLSLLVDGAAVHELARTPVSFGCTCSRDRLLAGLASCGAEEIGEMLSAGEPLEVHCDACGRQYLLEPAEIAALLSA